MAGVSPSPRPRAPALAPTAAPCATALAMLATALVTSGCSMRRARAHQRLGGTPFAAAPSPSKTGPLHAGATLCNTSPIAIAAA